MINQYEIPGILRNEIPSANLQVTNNKPSTEVYLSLNNFIDYTRHAIEEHNLSTTKKCFTLADRIYCNGDKLVKALIENTFVYSISSLLPFNKMERLRVRATIPNRLHNIYVKQMMQCGC